MASTNTSIEWTDRSWNPLRGCRVVSPGCENCYAQSIAYRFSGEGQAFEGLAKKVNGHARWAGEIRLLEKELQTPYKWKEPQKIFVNSMSDLFHEDVPFNFIDRVFRTMALADHHTYQILTKRPQRMLEYFQDVESRMAANGGKLEIENITIHRDSWPLSNVWLGVSVESQKYAEERIPLLLEVPATVRWLSCEPLLEDLDLSKWLWEIHYTEDGKDAYAFRDINWIVVGGESGHNARLCMETWIYSLVDQCAIGEVPIFVKQMGSVWASFTHSGTHKGGNPQEWMHGLRKREFPKVEAVAL